MKKFIVGTMLLILANSAFSQQNNPSPTLTKQDYGRKSKHQKTIAVCLAGGGIVLWLAGASKYMNQEDNIDGGGETAMAIGSIAALASIPMFIIASKNKRKAASISFKNEPSFQIQKKSFVYRAIPSLTLKFQL